MYIDNNYKFKQQMCIRDSNERADIKLRLFGDKDKIETELNKYTYNKEQIGITHTTEEISCNEAPACLLYTSRCV